MIRKTMQIAEKKIIFNKKWFQNNKKNLKVITKQINSESLLRRYRVLSLSATLETEFESILKVLNNICISKLEIKDKEDLEVK